MTKLCKIIRVSRSSYYKWIHRIKSNSQIENEKVQQKILKIHDEVNKIYGYRRMTVAVNRELGTNYNEKRIRRIMRINHIQSIIRRRKANWVKSSAAHIAENILNRKFHEITKPNQVWCTDVTEFKCKNNRKIYLSAIIDLYDYSIISHVISNRNNNALVMDTLKAAFQANPSAKPLIHSDRGFQYTSHEYNRLKGKFGFKVSMSRVSKCLDNQPIESFWGTLKAEFYYVHSFDNVTGLINGIEQYIHFYHHKRYVKKYDGLTPIEYRNQVIV